jgi:hypothetical protein
VQKDLAQMAKAKGIYRTLDLWAMLSPKLVGGETSKCLPKKDSSKAGKQVNGGDVDVKYERLASPR